MSTRALRKAREKAAAVNANSDNENESEEESIQNTPQTSYSKFSSSVFEDFVDDDDDDADIETEENIPPTVVKSPEIPPVSPEVMGDCKPKQKKRKKKKKAEATASVPLESDEEMKFLESAAVEATEMKNLISEDAKHSVQAAAARSLLGVDSRNLLADNEMRRIFGSDVFRNMNKQRRAHRQTVQKHAYKLAKLPPNSHPITHSGLSMTYLSANEGKQLFKFVHSKEYQKVQFAFFASVEAMQPEMLMKLLNAQPLHVDCLIQGSNYLRMSDDAQTAGTLIERALCVMESAFHPLFSVTNDKSRLPYKYPENRCLYIAIFHHLFYLTNKGCHRTALEFCKLVLSLSPEDDPLSMLLCIDSFAIRSKELKWMINFYNAWNPFKNLYQLPNFAFSVPLAEFLLNYNENSIIEDMDTKGLEDALISFPSVLREILDRCNIDADSKTESCSYFGMSADKKQLNIVTQFCKLYCYRIYHIWKQPEVMSWLEIATRRAIERVNNKDPLISQSESNRQNLYKGVPRNIYRHFLLADVKDIQLVLPTELQSQPVFLYDPLPPPDTEVSYERPTSVPRPQYPRTDSNMLRVFFEALFPNYGVDEQVLAEQGGAAGFNIVPPIEIMEAAVAEAMNDAPGDLPRDEAPAVGALGPGNHENLLRRLREMMLGPNPNNEEHGVFHADEPDDFSDEADDEAPEWEEYNPDDFQ